MAASLIKANACVNAAATDKWTPLHLAAASGHAAVADLLLDANASLTATDDFGETPAQIAELGGNHALAKRMREWQPGASSK